MFGKNLKAAPMINKGSHIAICVPTNGLLHSEFAFFLIDAIRYTESQGYPVDILMDLGTVLSSQRQFLARRAINEHNADYIMWFDSDMTFPEDTIVNLLERNKDIVCATYSKRVEPFHATAFEEINPVVPVEMSGSLKKVKYAGMGCMLVKADVYASIDAPWFPLTWHEQTDSWHGEDMGFCSKAIDSGFDVWCDIDLSVNIGHLGQQEFLLSRED
jgi:hypothetical protein